MSRAGRAIAVLALLGAGACDLLAPPPAPPPTVQPQARPSPAPQTPPPAETSAASLALVQYYARVQADLETQGLLRTDGGGPDTPFTAAMLVRNFERIALTDEYQRGAGLTKSDGSLGPILKWTKPVRIGAEFGATVPPDRRARDSERLNAYTARLARVTGHDISFGTPGTNFHVLVMGEDDRPQALARIRALVPDVDGATLALIRDLPRSIHCLVVAFPEVGNGFAYGKAIALIRDEHPDLMRRACFHEEVAQGLGLANDSPQARPSIFNDDDEFALLTTHDEMLLRILYDPRLTPGMSAEAARPIVRDIAALLTGDAG